MEQELHQVVRDQQHQAQSVEAEQTGHTEKGGKTHDYISVFHPICSDLLTINTDASGTPRSMHKTIPSTLVSVFSEGKSQLAWFRV